MMIDMSKLSIKISNKIDLMIADEHRAEHFAKRAFANSVGNVKPIAQFLGYIVILRKEISV